MTKRPPFTPPSEGSRRCMIYSRNNSVPPGVAVGRETTEDDAIERGVVPPRPEPLSDVELSEVFPIEPPRVDWHYGPTEWDAEPIKMWCYDCEREGKQHEVLVIDDTFVCVCGRQELVDDHDRRMSLP